jgi:hypothetical protein
MGCLTFPFRILAFLLLLAVLAGGWLYRDRLLDWGRGTFGARSPSAEVGTPSSAALSRARGSLARLGRPGVDSVVLDPDETASLLREAVGPAVARQIDSLRVDLSEGRVGFRASLRTARLPRELLGPLAVAVRDREPISAGGTVRMLRPGAAEWIIDRLTVRDFPLPSEAVPRVIGRAFGDNSRSALPLALPPTVRGIRVHPAGVTLFTREVR